MIFIQVRQELSIPFYCCPLFRCLDTHILFIPSSVDRHLSCFQFLVVMNKAAGSFRVHAIL